MLFGTSRCTLVSVIKKHFFKLLVPIHCGKTLSMGYSGTIVPLLIVLLLPLAPPPPCQRQRASHQVSPKTVKFGGCSAHPMWEM